MSTVPRRWQNPTMVVGAVLLVLALALGAVQLLTAQLVGTNASHISENADSISAMRRNQDALAARERGIEAAFREHERCIDRRRLVFAGGIERWAKSLNMAEPLKYSDPAREPKRLAAYDALQHAFDLYDHTTCPDYSSDVAHPHAAPTARNATGRTVSGHTTAPSAPASTTATALRGIERRLAPP